MSAFPCASGGDTSLEREISVNCCVQQAIVLKQELGLLGKLQLHIVAGWMPLQEHFLAEPNRQNLNGGVFHLLVKQGYVTMCFAQVRASRVPCHRSLYMPFKVLHKTTKCPAKQGAGNPSSVRMPCLDSVHLFFVLASSKLGSNKVCQAYLCVKLIRLEAKTKNNQGCALGLSEQVFNAQTGS